MTAARRRSLRSVPDRPQRVVLCRRISDIRGRAGDDFHSPEIQLSALRHATGGMREVCPPIDDFDESGRTVGRDGLNLDRPGLNRIRDMVTAGEVDVVAFYNVSRLGRNVLGSLLFVKHLEDCGARILSATEHIDTSTAVGKMMLTNMLAVAQLQADQIGESWARTIEIRAVQGKHHGRPFGYRRPKGGRLEPDPVHGPIMSWLFEAYAAGLPIKQIVAEVSKRRGKPTFARNIKKWLRNPVYLGHVVADGEVVTQEAHAPLVSPAIWKAVEIRLRHDYIAPPRHLDPTWSLVGLAVCPNGHRLQRKQIRSGGRLVDRLVCGMSTVRGPGHTCEGVGYPRLEPIEAEVLRRVAEYGRLLRTDDATGAARRAQRAQAVTQRKELEREMVRTQSAMARLAKAWALGDMTDAEYREPIAELRAAERELRQRLDELSVPVVTASPKLAAKAITELLELWPGATPAERSRLLRVVVRRVVVRPAGRWREPEADRVAAVDF